MVSNVSLTFVFIIVIISTFLSKYFCSSILFLYCGAVLNAVLSVFLR